MIFASLWILKEFSLVIGKSLESFIENWLKIHKKIFIYAEVEEKSEAIVEIISFCKSEDSTGAFVLYFNCDYYADV